MSDPRFQSIHLEKQQTRREQFRIARRAIEDQCGNQTMAGDLGMLDEGDAGDGPTLANPIGLFHAYWLTDGSHNHQLSVGVNSVGRLPDNNVCIKDEHISRRHFAIVIHSDGRCEIHDIASKNGTVLNGTKINGPTRLSPGDEITVCTRRMKFVAGNPPSVKSKSKSLPPPPAVAGKSFLAHRHERKAVPLDRLIALRESARRDGKTVVWTNGCFDLLHPGHVASLTAARALGDMLIVELNSDASVKANKGPTRPILDESARTMMLSALSVVDQVIVFDEPTPERILSILQPDIHTKGREYAPPHGRPVPEAKIVQAYGGRIEYLPLVPGFSTTELIRRIAAAHAAHAL